MFLKRITVQNVRSIESLDLSFAGGDSEPPRKRTILLGENGAGKSTVLRSMRWRSPAATPFRSC